MSVKVELLVSRGGPSGIQNRGDVIEVGADEAHRMIMSGQCVAVQSSYEKREKAIKKPKGKETR